MKLTFEGKEYDTKIKDDMAELQAILNHIDSRQKARTQLAALFKPKDHYAGTD
jgi:hypothetical protein